MARLGGLVIILLSIFASTLRAASVILKIQPSNVLPNPNALPPSTHATITAPNGEVVQSSIRKDNTIILDPINTLGSHLLNIYSRDYLFASYRIDTNLDPSSLSASDAANDEKAVLISFAAQLFPGTHWSDTGVSLLPQNPAPNPNSPVEQRSLPVRSLTFAPRVIATRNFYEDRPAFNPLSLLKNPMILLGIVALAFTFGMPKLMENMDPEMRAEYEEMQKKGPTAAIGRAMNGGTPSGGDFDLAGYLAGSGKKEASAESAGGLRDKKR